MNHKTKGLGFLGIIIVLAIIAGGGYLVSKNLNKNVAVDETANWKTYQNDKYGFEFKYPASYEIKDTSNIDFNSLPNIMFPLVWIYDPAGTIKESEEVIHHNKYLQVIVERQPGIAGFTPRPHGNVFFEVAYSPYSHPIFPTIASTFKFTK